MRVRGGQGEEEGKREGEGRTRRVRGEERGRIRRKGKRERREGGEKGREEKEWVEECKVVEERELLHGVLPIHTCHLSGVTGHGRACPCWQRQTPVGSPLPCYSL